MSILESISTWHWVVIGAVVVYFGAAYIKTQRFIRQHGCKDPIAAKENFWLGSIPGLPRIMEKKKNGEMVDYFKDYFFKIVERRTLWMRLGHKRVICTIEPENIKAMLATQFNDFSLGTRHAHFKPLLGDGIFTLDGEGWKHSRAMLRPQFSREQVAHVKSLEPHLQTLASIVKLHKGETVDLQDLFFKLTVDTASEFLFGESVESLQDTLDTARGVPLTEKGFEGKAGFAEAFNVSQSYLSTRVIFQMFYWVVNNREFRKSCDDVHRFARYYVRKALDYTPQELEEKSKDGYIFLYELVKQTRNPTVLQDQLLNILVAGRDTTAGVLSFIFFELARHPAIWEKLKAEIYENFGQGDDADVEAITFESLKKCEYLKFVINEALRLYPSVPINVRVATKDTTLPVGGGEDGLSPVYVGKGTSVAYSVYITHRLEEYYGKDAEEFRPERWAELGKLGWAYLPFNGGPRICLGQQFALTEASYITARLAQMFPNLVSRGAGHDVVKKASHITLSVQEGTLVSMTE